jgi:hypothetical protein
MSTSITPIVTRSGDAVAAASAARTPQPLRAAFALGFALLIAAGVAAAGQRNLLGPSGSSAFGSKALLLPNGNIVVADFGGLLSSSVHLMRPDGSIISTLSGTADDRLGSGGIVLLANGNYVVDSHEHDAPGTENAGAVTWGDADTGTPATVNANSSLLGAVRSGDTTNNRVQVDALDNGDYVVRWSVPSAGFGAWTWANGDGTTVGTMSAANSLTTQLMNNGDSAADAPVLDLGGGRFLVVAPEANNDSRGFAGAVTRGGRGGQLGEISAANSLMGERPFDAIGSGGVVLLGNGQAVVSSPDWSNGAGGIERGAVTWIDANQNPSGVVSAANSLVGNSNSDRIGQVTSIGSGRYMIVSPDWHNTADVAVGAATWVNSAVTRSGTVTAANSLIGTTAGDLAGARVTPLLSRNFVIAAPSWDGGRMMADAGAVVWANGGTGITGTIGVGNALIGNGDSDRVGQVVALNDGNYVVSSPNASFGTTIRAGAVTWGNGSVGIVGRISAANSLVGGSSGDGDNLNVAALQDAGYAVAAPHWENGSMHEVGVVVATRGPRLVGTITAATALRGLSAFDGIGFYGLRELADGSLLVRSPRWSGGRGALTRWQPQVPAVGAVVSAENSMVGSRPGEGFGFTSSSALAVLPDEGYAFLTRNWYDEDQRLVGAVTLARNGSVGTVNASNSVLGIVPDANDTLSIVGYDPERRHLVVAQPAVNVISLLDDSTFANGFE